MEGPKVKQLKSDPHGNLSNKQREKNSNENTDPQGNLAVPLLKKNSAIPPHRFCKGKSIVERSNKTIELVDQGKKSNENTESSVPHGDLLTPLKQQQKKSVENSKKANLFDQITIREADMPRKFNLSRCQLKEKSALPPPSILQSKGNTFDICSKRKKSDESLDPNGDLANSSKKSIESSKKPSLLNQIAIREADMSQRFNLSRCQLNNKSVLSIHRLCKGKKMDIADQAIGIFPEEIIMEILSRLPVRSLHGFKCVSKFWKALISDPYFKKKHLNRAKNDPNLQRFLVAKTCLHVDRMYSFYSSSLSSVQLVEDEQKLDLPSNCKPRGCKILCTCDGLVLLTVSEDHGKNRAERHLFLWNPSTRESIALPLPKPSVCHCVCGMGYDSASDDYKILAIDFNRPEFEVSSEILAVKSGSWRVSKYPTSSRCFLGFRDTCPECLAFLHGAFHWFGCDGYINNNTNNNIHDVTPRGVRATIVRFDISSEVYGEIPLQEGMCDILFRRNSTESIENGVSLLGGMLCFFSTFHNQVEGSFKLWVMKEYGVKESWTVLLAIQDANLFYAGRPRYRYADGEVLLAIRHTGLIGYVHRTSRGPFGLWPEDHVYRQGIVYTESLISPKLLI